MNRLLLTLPIFLGLTLASPTVKADSASEIATQDAQIKTLDAQISGTSDQAALGNLYGERASAYRLRALELQKLNRYEEAKNDFIRSFEDTRKSTGKIRNREAELFARVAYCQFKLNEFEDAKVNMGYARTASGYVADEPFFLEKSAKIHLASEEYDAAIADCIAIRASTKSTPETKQTSYILESTAIYLRGDFEGAVSKWREMAVLNPKFSAYNIFDPLQAPFNKAVAASPKDLTARINRARFFLDRANQKRYPNYYEAKSSVNLGGLINLIDSDIVDVEPHSFYQAAYYDWTKAIETKKQPSFYAERALAAHLWNAVAPASTTTKIKQRMIDNDVAYAAKNGSKDGETLRALGRFYEDSSPASIDDPKWRPTLQNSIFYYSLALIHDPTYAENSKLRETRGNQMGMYLNARAPEPPKVKPTTPLQWKEYGNELTNKNQFSAALNAYNKALEIDPKFADAYNNKGNIYIKIGAYDLALKEFDAAIAADPKHRIAYFNRSTIWETLEDSAKAFADSSKAIQFATTPAHKTQALKQRADLYFKSQRYTQALADLTNLTTIDPKDAYGWTFRGQVEIMLKDLPAAITSLQKSAALDSARERTKLMLITANHLNGSPAPTKIEGKTEEKQWLHRFLISKQMSALYASDDEQKRIKTLVELVK